MRGATAIRARAHVRAGTRKGGGARGNTIPVPLPGFTRASHTRETTPNRAHDRVGTGALT